MLVGGVRVGEETFMQDHIGTRATLGWSINSQLKKDSFCGLKKMLKTTGLDHLKRVFLLPALSLLSLPPRLLGSQLPSFCHSEPVRIEKK